MSDAINKLTPNPDEWEARTKRALVALRYAEAVLEPLLEYLDAEYYRDDVNGAPLIGAKDAIRTAIHVVRNRADWCRAGIED